MTDEAQRAKALAHQVVLAQGNLFIKELLRERGRIGATKEDFARNLEAAIEEGALRLADIEVFGRIYNGSHLDPRLTALFVGVSFVSWFAALAAFRRRVP